MRLIGVLSITALLLLFFAAATPPAIAQQGVESDQPADAAAAPEEQEKEKRPFALYVAVAYGETTADSLNSSITSSATQVSTSYLEFDQTWTRSAIGWSRGTSPTPRW